MNRRPTQSRSGYDSFSPQHTAHFTAAKPGTDFFEPRKKKPLIKRLFMLLLLIVNIRQSKDKKQVEEVLEEV